SVRRLLPVRQSELHQGEQLSSGSDQGVLRIAVLDVAQHREEYSSEPRISSEHAQRLARARDRRLVLRGPQGRGSRRLELPDGFRWIPSGRPTERLFRGRQWLGDSDIREQPGQAV